MARAEIRVSTSFYGPTKIPLALAIQVRTLWVMAPDRSFEHIAEIGEILAAGLMRLTTAKSSQTLAVIADKPVDCEGVWSSAVAARDEESRE